MHDELPIEYLAPLRVAETGLSAAELTALDMDEFASVTGRPTMGEIAAHALDSAPPAQQAPAPAQTPAPEQPDPLSMDWQDYAAWREASGLAARSNEGMSHASVSLMDRLYRRNDYGR